MARTYLDMLTEAGWPTDVLVLDFENYFDAEYTLRKMSTIEFIEDPRYECLGLASLRIRPERDNSVPDFDHDAGALLGWCQGEYGRNLEGCTVLAQNARYDGTILVRKYDIHPPYVVDLLGIARALYPGYKNDLASLCKRLGMRDKDDTDEFKGLGWWDTILGPPRRPSTVMTRKKDKRVFQSVSADGNWVQEVIRRGMSPLLRLALDDYAKNDAQIEWEVFKQLAPRFSRPEVELSVMRQTLDMFWHPSIPVDMDLGEELASTMESKVDEAASDVGHTPKELRSAKFPRILQDAGAIPLPMKEGKKGSIIAIAKEDPGREELLHHDNSNVRALMEAFIAVKSWPLHSKRVRKIMAQAKAAGGMLPVPLRYMGCHTGRWSGDESINLQNLSKRTLIELLLRVRSLLIAPPGHKLAVTDASQIEARVLAWIAGQDDLVRAFKDGIPVYCKFASEVVGVPVRKARKRDFKLIRDTLTRYRNFGKIGILGAGYGMGPPRCREFASQVYQVVIDLDMAKRIIGHYRKVNDRVVKFWGELEGAMKFVVRYPNETTELSKGRIRLENDCGTVTVRLPCGRKLYYHDMQITKRAWPGSSRVSDQLRYPEPIKPGWKNVWGGLLTENLVQAMSRDILAEAMLEADRRGAEIGMRVGLHVHDEMVSVVPDAVAQTGLDIQLDALRHTPSWAEGCPLDAEGWIKERYGK